MEDVTAYAPVRIALLGIARVIFGLLVAVMGVVAVWSTASGDTAPRQPGDMPSWWMSLVGLALGLGGFAIASGGVGRLISAFAQDCYIRSGPDGLAIRLPVQGWFGRFKLTEYNFQWSEIKQMVHFTHSVNLIPVSRELRIELETGKTVIIKSYYFSASVKSLQQQLVTIQASVGR
jgi:hypothetical protein